VAIEAGEYEETLNITRNITLVGRCAARVVLRSEGALFGIDVTADATLRGVTLRDHQICAAVFYGASLRIVDSLVEDCLERGVGVEGAGARLQLERSVIRGTQSVNSTASDGYAVQAVLGASVELVDSALIGNVGAAVLLAEPGTSGTFTSSVIRDTQPNRHGELGFAINALPGTDVTVAGSVLANNHRAAINASGSHVVVQDSVLRDTTYPEGHDSAFGIIAYGQASVEVRSTSLARNHGAGATVLESGTMLLFEDSVVLDSAPDRFDDLGSGLYVFGGSTVTLERSALVGNRRSGLEVYDAGTLAGVSASLIRDGVGRPNGRMGIGITTAGSAQTLLSGSAVLSSLHSGVFAWSGGRVEMEASIVSNTALETALQRLGHGVLAMSGAFVRISGSTVAWSEQVGVVFTSASGQVSASTLANNAVAIHAQDGSELREVDVASPEVPPNVVEVTRDTHFVSNGSRTGTGPIEVPEPPDLPL